jgi:hypothetical protein
MIRPQSWIALYRNHPNGLQLNTGGPTLLARWLFFVFGTIPVAGVALGVLALRSDVEASTARFLRIAGSCAISLGLFAQAASAAFALGAQPSSVLTAVEHDPLYGPFFYLWMGTAALFLVSGLFLPNWRAASIVAAVLAFLNVASTVMVRDGIRDYTLRASGFEVWNRVVVTNWSVVGIFLVLFVAALGVIAYLIAVIARARRLEEIYA